MPHTYLHSLDNEDQLLARLKEGDQVAFTKLFNHYRDNIYGVGYNFLKSPVLAEEIVQDVFLKIWLKRKDLGEVKNFNAYLFVMARNFIFDRVKKMSYDETAKTEWKQAPFYVDDTEYLVRHHQCEQLLKNAIQLLPPRQKEVYCLAKQDGLSQEKIAGIMNLSKLTVKTHMAKALQAIRRYLDSQLNNFFPVPLMLGMLYFF